MQAPTPRLFIAFIALLVMTLVTLMTRAAHADWREEASSFDLSRLQHLQQSRTQGLSEAARGGGMGDASAILETLSPAGYTIGQSALMGSWRCRQMKLGGMTSYIVYGWFNCSIRAEGGGLFFEKTSGTLHMQGFLYPENGAWVYLGAVSAPGEPAHRYSGDGASVGAPATPDDQIGLLTGIGRNRLRIELPEPIQESDFDAIELER